MKITKMFMALLAVALVACEAVDDTPNPQPPVDDPTEEPKGDDDDNTGGSNDDNTGDNTEELGPIEIPEGAEDATYTFVENLDVRVHPMQTNGLRNDYVSLFDVYTDRTLFIDFYAPIECEYLPSGYYPLGDGSSMTSDREYTYITLETNGELIRFEDGWAEVRATPQEDGSVKHEVAAHYTMESGETVWAHYEGVMTIKIGI